MSSKWSSCARGLFIIFLFVVPTPAAMLVAMVSPNVMVAPATFATFGILLGFAFWYARRDAIDQGKTPAA